MPAREYASDSQLDEFLVAQLNANPGLLNTELYKRQAADKICGLKRIKIHVHQLREEGLVPPQDERVTTENCLELCAPPPSADDPYTSSPWKISEDQTIIRIMRERLEAKVFVLYASEMQTLMAALPNRSALSISKRFRGLLHAVKHNPALISSNDPGSSSPLSSLSDSPSEQEHNDATVTAPEAKGSTVSNPTAEHLEAAEALLSLRYGAEKAKSMVSKTVTNPTSEDLEAAEILLSLHYGAEKAKSMVDAAQTSSQDTEIPDAS